MNDLTLRVPSVQESFQIKSRLNAFNQAHVGPYGLQMLELIYLDSKDQVIAGILGWTMWSWFHIDSLWVDEPYRKQGLASQLMKEAEKLAIERGCNLADVDTFDFQALGFYKKQGYECFGQLEGIAGSLTRFYLKKTFA